MRWDFNFHVQAGLWIYADDPSSSDPASGTALDRARALFVAQAESIWEGGGEGLVMIRFENASAGYGSDEIADSGILKYA